MSNDDKPDNSPDVVTAAGHMIFSDSTGAPHEAPTQKPDSSPDNSPDDALVEKILKAIRAEESGTPLGPLGQGQVRNQPTIGELLDSISEEHLGDRRATFNELMRIVDVGVDLFSAAIAHCDVTPEVLEEARGLWGPLADVVDKPRRPNHPVAQPVQLSPEILSEMEDMDLLPHEGDWYWDEMWDEFVASLGGVPQAVKACRERQLRGQRDLRAHVVRAGKSYQRRADRGKPTAVRRFLAKDRAPQRSSGTNNRKEEEMTDSPNRAFWESVGEPSDEECPVCKREWHGLRSEKNGCPGECGSDEEKKQWLHRQAILAYDVFSGPNRAFWESSGTPSHEEYTKALAVAYDSGDERELSSVLCEVSGSGIEFEVLTAFMQLNHGPRGN
jgi:hypothetical protein